jgi:spoIIIJ-associated protein
MTAKEMLDTMLGYLGIACQIEEQRMDGDLFLQIYTGESDLLIGQRGEVMLDMQFLLNRLLQVQDPAAERVNIDVEHHRAIERDRLIEWVRARADRVRRTGRPVTLDPMNAYDRRVVHNLFKDDPEVATSSPPGEQRLKSITLRRKGDSGAAPSGPRPWGGTGQE